MKLIERSGDPAEDMRRFLSALDVPITAGIMEMRLDEALAKAKAEGAREAVERILVAVAATSTISGGARRVIAAILHEERQR